MGKFNIQKLRKEYSSIPVTQHHPLPFSKGEYKDKKSRKLC